MESPNPPRHTVDMGFADFMEEWVAPFLNFAARTRDSPWNIAKLMKIFLVAAGYIFYAPVIVVMAASRRGFEPSIFVNFEKFAFVLGFFMPQRFRDRVFLNVIEEVREDRIVAKAAPTSKAAEWIIELGFLWRLMITFVQCQLEWLCSIIAKISPILKWLVGGNG